ncbi:MAG: conjugative relaxase [Gammaproteobacteria bacterium]|nr:conjugative relaxase [Gammaproteobacteria bacterium]
MLTLFSLNNAKQAAKYYEQDNYYHKGSVESIAATHWWGKGAEALGLVDYVDPERFIELLRGKIDPHTILERVRHDGGVGHKPGYDLTFSAPKSVSMLVEIGKDYRIYDAHNKAVNAALEYFQSTVAMYRHTVDSHTQIKKGDNLTVAKFRHDTSRSVGDTIDCQLHTHCIVMNAIVCEDGKWRSLFEKPFFDFKMVGGMIYRSALAKELKELGYTIEKTREDGLFEVAGFTREHIEAFSQRRVKIVEVMKEQGLFGAQAAQAVTLGLREYKIAIDREKLEAHWQERIQGLGVDLNEIIKLANHHQKSGINKNNDSKLIADQAVQYAIDHLGERQSVFYEKDIIKTSLQYALGEIQVADVHQAIERSQKKEQLVSLGRHQHLALYTSPKIIAQEQRIVEIMQLGKNEWDAIASKEAAELYINDLTRTMPEGKQLTHCQTKAIRFLSTHTDRVVGVQGYAGTGKTTLLNAVCRIAEAAGYRIRGAAPSASAADVLRTDTGITTETLSGLLLSLQKEEPSQDSIRKPEIIILDEASMASTHQMYDLLEQAERLNKRIFLVGDRQQLPAVENGAPYSLLQDENMAFTTLTEIVRQEAKDLSYAVRETIHGDIGYAMQAIGNEAFIEKNSDGEALFNPESTVNVIANKNERLQTIANTYLALETEKKENTLVLLGSNEDRQTVNGIIRDGLKEQGVITGEEAHATILQSKGLTAIERTHLYNYEIGDIVRFNKAYRSLGIKRYDYLTVIGMDRETNELLLDRQGKEIRWQPGKAAQSKGGAAEVFTQAERTLAAGDFIRWTQNKKTQEIYNTETARVFAVKGDIAQVKLRNGKTVELDLTQSINSHWDYAWVSTIYAAQGKKARNVIAQLEGANPNLTNYRSFYVTLSRAVNSIHLYVDDLDQAIKAVKTHTGEKSNATEFLTAHKAKQQFEKHLKTAYLKLDGNIHEVPNEWERLVHLAKHYASFDDLNKIHLIAPDFKDRTLLNALIREELKEKHRISNQDIEVERLRKYRVRSNDQNMQFTKGTVIGFDRGYKKYGIKKGSYLTVEDVHLIENKVTLRPSGGGKITLDIPFLVERQNKDIEVCKIDPLKLAVGDEIIWTKNYKKDHILQGQQAKVREITNTTITLELANHQTMTLNNHDPRAMHWDYAYAKGIDAPVPKHYDVGLAHLDERTKSPARIQAIFGAMGGAKNGAYIYTHSKDYVVNQLQKAAEQDANLQSSQNQNIEKEIYQALEKFEQSRRTVSKAWVTYFENKKAGVATEDNLRNALILDRAHAELAHQLIQDNEFNQTEIASLGFNLKRMRKDADKHLKHTKQLERLKLTREERRDAAMLDAYLAYNQQARQLWQRMDRAKANGLKPQQSSFAFATHVSRLRNELAQEIVLHPERFDRWTVQLSTQTKQRIEEHARQYTQRLEQILQRRRIVQTKDWRAVIQDDQDHGSKGRSIQHRAFNQPQRTYWDKERVLREVMPKAEEIVSSLITEEKNNRLSKGDQIVWGKKHGSVHLHVSGSKEGVVNDYERGIHGDVIHYYARMRGIDWYDSLAELAARVGLDPYRTSLKPLRVSKEEERRREQALLTEQKRRHKMRMLAQKTWNEAQPLQGTLAERYLKKHRAINCDLSRLEVRFHPKAPNVISYQEGKVRVGDRRPAMLVSFINAADELTGIQCTYLDKETGNKDKEVKIGKCSIGQIWGSAGVIYRGGSEKVIVGEGAETAASLIAAAPDSSIYITGGNMQNVGSYDFLAKQHHTKELHIAADNDLSFEAGSWKATEAGAKKLAASGIKPLVARPETIKNSKTDYNDVLKRYGTNEMKRQFVPLFTMDVVGQVKDEVKLVPVFEVAKQVSDKEQEQLKWSPKTRQ